MSKADRTCAKRSREFRQRRKERAAEMQEVVAVANGVAAAVEKNGKLLGGSVGPVEGLSAPEIMGRILDKQTGLRRIPGMRKKRYGVESGGRQGQGVLYEQS